MAYGTLAVDTLNSSTGVLASQNGMTGICKAWVRFDGTVATPSTIYGAFNVSSVTRNGTGDYTINFTTAMPNVNYCIVATTQGARVIMGTTLANYATGSCNVTSYDVGGSAYFNANPINVVIFSS